MLDYTVGCFWAWGDTFQPSASMILPFRGRRVMLYKRS